MLQITIPKQEGYDPVTKEFYQIKQTSIVLEHSLVSISKWEAKWCKPFMSRDKKTTKEILNYIECMTITQAVDPNVYKFIPADEVKKITDYISAPMTATTFSDTNTRRNSQIITSEVIYYLMIAYGIPFECQKWHINRLMTLIRVCEIKNSPGKKMSKGDIMRQNAQINAARRSALNSRG